MNALLKKMVKWGGGLLVVGLVGIQLVPYGRNHTNPPLQNEPNWDSPETPALAKRACFDCAQHKLSQIKDKICVYL